MNTVPTQAGFATFITTFVGVPSADMPTTDQQQQYLDMASQWVPLYLNTLAGGPSLSTNSNSSYVTCIYNWAASVMINFQADATGQNFFATARKTYNIGNWVPGPLSSVSDETTSTAMELGEGMKNLTFVDMQRAKDPYGRAALEIMQALGSNWGLS